jgi:hypothetical protein
MASNEGFGIGTLEAMMAERMIIATVTGGLQDQLGFTDDDGNYLDPDVHFNADWGSNAEGKFLNHGGWAIPLFPSNRSLIGSPATPYIFDDRADYKDAGQALEFVYRLSPEERAERGAAGRAYALTPEVAMSTNEMCKRLIQSIDKCFETWTPKPRFGIYKA